MATSAGELEYIVTVNTQGMLTGVSSVTKAGNEMASAMKAADNASSGLNTTVSKTAQAVNEATTKTSSLKGMMGQLGYQIQDVSVQLAGGQNALMVFGQQGSQIASLFGPTGAVVGAVLAVASAIGVALVNALSNAGSQFDALTTKVKDLTIAQRELAKVQVREEMDKINKELKTYNSNLAVGQTTGEGFSKRIILNNKGVTEARASQEVLNKRLEEYKQRLNELNGVYLLPILS